MDERIALTVEEAAHRLGVSKAHLYSSVLSGDLRSLRLGKRRLIPVAALEEFVERKTSTVAGTGDGGTHPNP